MMSIDHVATTLRAAGFETSCLKNGLIVCDERSPSTRFALRLSDVAIQVAYRHPRPVPADLTASTDKLLVHLNAELPFGQWRIEKEPMHCCFHSYTPLTTRPQKIQEQLVGLVRAHCRLFAGSLPAIEGLLLHSWPLDQARAAIKLSQFQPQLESLSPDDQIDGEQWRQLLEKCGL